MIPLRLAKFVIDKLRQSSGGLKIDSSWLETTTLPGAFNPALPSAQNISALRIVSSLNGQYGYADPLDPIAAWAIAGISLQSVSTGGLLAPANNQVVADQSWNWVRGSPVFLGANGTLTQISPITGYLVTVARVFDSKTLFIHIEDPIKL